MSFFIFPESTTVVGYLAKKTLMNIDVIASCWFQANAVRDALAKSLFCRTVSAIVKRANSMKRPTSNSTVSSDSNESFSNSGIYVIKLINKLDWYHKASIWQWY